MENNNYVKPVEQPGNGLAIAALVVGIIGILISCFYGIGLIPCIVAIILAAVAKKKGHHGGMSTAGLIVSIAGALINLLLGFLMIAILGISVLSYYEQATNNASLISSHNSAIAKYEENDDY